jgi:hypothetical protein
LVESFAGIAVMVDDYNTRALLGEKVDPYAYCQISSTLGAVIWKAGAQGAQDRRTPWSLAGWPGADPDG